MVNYTTLPYKICPQVVAAFIAATGALCAGLALGWSALSEQEIKGTGYKFSVSDEEFSWVGSSLTLAAAVSCIPTGIICNLIGRKPTMIVTAILMLCGWLLLVFNQNLIMMYCGRIVIGLACGGTCVVAPTYIAEISAKEIRGALASFFQLLITLGILAAYLLGWKLSLMNENIACAAISGTCLVLLFFIPESPNYYIFRGKSDKALKSYKWLRGKNYDASGEVAEIEAEINAIKSNPVPFYKAMTRKSSYKGLIISVGLMIFQQTSGINVAVFYTGDIFLAAKSELDHGLEVVIIGIVMFLVTFISIVVIDLLGRTIMLMVSALFMLASLVPIGFYFYMVETKGDASVDAVRWLPILCLSVFVVAFSLGFGPIPWIMCAELFGTDVRGPCAAITGCVNWIMAFIVTKTFVNILQVIGRYGVFWVYACFCLLAFFFIALIVPETKNKSLNEITDELNRTKIFKDFKATFKKAE